MSKRDLLDLSVFDDQRKSLMVYRRPELIRKSDPSVYDKMPEPQPVEYSKANYWTTAPGYDGRTLSDVELDNPKCSNYMKAAGLIAVWVLSQAQLIPAYSMLGGNWLQCCIQLALLRFLIALGQLILQEQSIGMTGKRFYRAFYAFLMLTTTIFCTIVLVHNISPVLVALLLNCDAIVNSAFAKQRVTRLGVLVLPVLYYVNYKMIVVGAIAAFLLSRFQAHSFDVGQQIQASVMSLVLFMLIGCFSEFPVFHLDEWTILSLGILSINRFISHRFLPLIVKNYVRSTTALYFLKANTVVLGVFFAVYQQPVLFCLLLVAVAAQMACQQAYRDRQQRTTLILHENL